MLERLKNISLFLVMATILVVFSKSIASLFLFEFIKNNLITILIALLAINTTTGSVVMTKLRDISDKNGVDFSSTIGELRSSIVEQVVFIILGIILLILAGSPIILELYEYMSEILNILLVSVFIGSLYNLYDTANSIFVILNHENDENQKIKGGGVNRE